MCGVSTSVQQSTHTYTVKLATLLATAMTSLFRSLSSTVSTRDLFLYNSISHSVVWMLVSQ